MFNNWYCEKGEVFRVNFLEMVKIFCNLFVKDCICVFVIFLCVFVVYFLRKYVCD